MFGHLVKKGMNSGRVHPNGEREPLHSLLRFSFLDEYLDDERLAHTLGFTPLDEEATLRRIATAATQIQARSRGLLEPWEPIEDEWFFKHSRSRVTAARAMAVRYTHRSIHEFLGRFLASSFAKTYLDGFDCIKAQINNFTALLKYSEFNVAFYRPHGIGYEDSELWHLLLEVQEAPSPEDYFGSLDILEDTFRKIYATHFVGFDRLRWEVYRSINLSYEVTSARLKTIWSGPMPMEMLMDRRIRLATPLYVAAATSFHQYIHWKLETCPDAWSGSDGAELLFLILIGDIGHPRYLRLDIQSSKFHVLGEVLKLGGNPNFAFRNLKGGSVGKRTTTPWQCFLDVAFGSKLVGIDAEHEIALLYEYGRWEAIEMMLEFGGVTLPPFWSIDMHEKSSLRVILAVGDSKCTTTSIINSETASLPLPWNLLGGGISSQ
jgi:hypothetical protein